MVIEYVARISLAFWGNNKEEEEEEEDEESRT